jgi:hypothetical protein
LSVEDRIIERALEILSSRVREGAALTSPGAVRAAQTRLPGVFDTRVFVEDGALMATYLMTFRALIVITLTSTQLLSPTAAHAAWSGWARLCHPVHINLQCRTGVSTVDHGNMAEDVWRHCVRYCSPEHNGVCSARYPELKYTPTPEAYFVCGVQKVTAAKIVL